MCSVFAFLYSLFCWSLRASESDRLCFYSLHRARFVGACPARIVKLLDGIVMSPMGEFSLTASTNACNRSCLSPLLFVVRRSLRLPEVTACVPFFCCCLCLCRIDLIALLRFADVTWKPRVLEPFELISWFLLTSGTSSVLYCFLFPAS